uniref:Translation initiation factor eIF2B subunit alpha n=1 Tax=Trieres chinensis TaxID=1514140 RepID=A0A7S2EC59_TRICV|eukprot:CAMPEP_0183297082 /NCGR_PEP_ID=MMETSP0160_2-20130417/4451_1 /TAXON_ID=2839 ORGANISM="Odontella Sinensis, Strain Grunow 1884" /NCGR_SAMPLE_ID=MMETSP0160_2 /ASSEMBLY_ACC=CAM_ASM_000250 /LENGTH=397 /DNA_ID=CAMNT_0025458825 /DNA_START=32 /DNA_END=1225 /DNA_ORIENTATION=-
MATTAALSRPKATPMASSASVPDDIPVLRDLRMHLTGDAAPSLSSSSSPPSSSSPASATIDPERRSAVALPVAAIKSLLGVIRRSEANTMMGLQEELREAGDAMMTYARTSPHALGLGGRSTIALASGCELFMKYVTRCFLEAPDFATCMANVVERGERFADISLAARDRIADVGRSFVRDGSVVLTHGWSRVVASILLKAAETRHFSVIVLEGRPDAAGAKAAKVYADAGIPTTVVLDSAMGYVMERADMVVVGAEGVVENGGVVNKMGTYALGVCARESGKPFYVAAESYKFARLFPLNQRDLPTMGPNAELTFVDTASWEATGGMAPTKGGDSGIAAAATTDEIPGVVRLRPGRVEVENPPCDYTPAKYITLLFTDLGVLTPSAVSDELIRLYQ